MKTDTIALVLSLVCAAACLAQENDPAKEFRYWTTSTGKKSSVRLKLISQDAETVRLKREDNGQELGLSIERLSPADRQFLAEAAKSTVSTAQPSEDWPCFRGPNRNGISNAKLDLRATPKELWKFENLGSRYLGSPSLAGGRVYVNGGRVNGAEPLLYCFDADSGELVWKVAGCRTNSTPTVHKGRVYTVGDRHFARCYDAKSGRLIWKSEQLPQSTPGRQYGHAGSPLVHDGLLIVNYGGGAAVSLTDGKIAWQHPGFAGLATPVMFTHRGEPAVAIFSGDQLVARNPQTGKTLWSIERPAGRGVNAASPIFIENDTKVFVSSGYAKNRSLYDVRGSETTEIWTTNTGSNYASGVYVDGTLYGMAGGFGRVNLQTGKRETRGPSADSVLVIDGKWLFLSGGGKLKIGSIDNGKFNQQIETQILEDATANAPAYWQGKLYVRGKAGTLVCTQIGK